MTNLSACISNTKFYNNSAIHQGGAIAMISLDSVNCLVDISECEFIGNRALGNFLRSRSDTVIDFDTDSFINKVDQVFSTITDGLTTLPLSAGGIGSGISVSLYGSSEFNELRVKNSKFTNNWAVISGAVALLVRSSLTVVEDGVNTNNAVITKYVMYCTLHLLFGCTYVRMHIRVRVRACPCMHVRACPCMHVHECIYEECVQTHLHISICVIQLCSFCCHYLLK